MRTFLVSSLLVLLSLHNLSAGRLDIAVIQFPEEKGEAELNEALSGQSLFELTNSNRTMTGQAYLKGGSILFAQSLAASAGAGFGSTTRIRDDRADVEGQLGSRNISLSVTLTEGVKSGLRSFQKKVYTGSGSLSAGTPRILSLRQIRIKAPSVVKGQAKMEKYNLTIVVVAQYTP